MKQSYEDFMKQRVDELTNNLKALEDSMGGPAPPPPPASKVPGLEFMREFMKYDTDKNMKLNFEEFLAMQPPEVRSRYSEREIRSWFDAADGDGNGYIDPNEFFAMKSLPPLFPQKEVDSITDTDLGYQRTPWWRQGSFFSELQRKDRRSIFMHDDWVRHRSSERFLRNMLSIGSSGINSALSKVSSE